MSNRINPMDQGVLGKVGSKVGDTSSTRKVDGSQSTGIQDAAQGASTGDTVELTSSAKLLARLEKTLAAIPDVDASRVAEVKRQIENGEYQIDAGKIAEAMLRMDQEIDDGS